MTIKLILFDLDGTLVDTVTDIRNALNYALNPYGTKNLSVEQTKNLIGEGINRLIEKCLGKEGVQWRDAAITRFLDYYSKHLIDNSTVYPSVRETLEKLSAYKKAIISNKKEGLSKDLLEKLDLLKHFELIIGSDTASERKPSAVPVIFALAKFNIGPHEAVIVGDSNYDIEAGEKAGVKTIAVTYGYRERRYLLDADHIINSFNDLFPVLDIISAELI
jgi:phosphoglycolate phosphatase